ncbi:GNAT family N-acetyltransferase [Rhodobacteraceae bacterium M385]|nr:GNAT family N-acetyltransferase [Rhodobacteraceae bacterium M385]
MDGDTQISIEVLTSLSQIAPEDWDACACPEAGRPLDPFTTYRFLNALEQSGSVGQGTGWQPRYLVARQGDLVIACAPMYAKGHSQGEYIFDHNWAHAYENAGGQYYPKLQIAAPFTPATGRRFLTRPGHDTTGISALIQAAVQIAADNELSSIHITFCTEDEAIAGERIGLMRRVSQQFHWVNDGYASFDDFLGNLSSRKRKNIRKERARAQDFGGEIVSLTGEQIKPEHWDAFWHFYQDTGARKWGTPYLTRAFFDLAHQTMADDMLLCLAIRDGQPVAGALNFIGADTLYGRYWGCVEDHPCLHFELCYYRAIDFAIAQGLSRVEAGAQGTHKLARGYMPVATHSLHWVGDAGFAKAIGDYLEAERNAIDEEIEVLTSYGPFKAAQVGEQE